MNRRIKADKKNKEMENRIWRKAQISKTKANKSLNLNNKKKHTISNNQKELKNSKMQSKTSPITIISKQRHITPSISQE